MRGSILRSSAAGAARGLPLVIASTWLLGACGGDATSPVRRLVTATADGGASAAFVASSGGAGDWSADGELVVSEGAEMLFVASLVDRDDAGLAGVTITLSSPDGARSVTLSEGAVTLVGLDPVDLATPDADAALEAWLDEDLFAGVPDDASDGDIARLRTRFLGGDPDTAVAAPPGVALAAIDAGEAELRALRGKVALGADEAAPADGLIVFGPDAGAWTVHVEAPAGAGAFEVMAWTLPAQGDGAAIGDVAGALAAAAGGPTTTTGALGPGEGDDPGGAWHLERFRDPPAWTPEYFRAKAYLAAYTVVQWLVLRGIFTKAIDVLLKLEGTTALVVAGVTKDQLKTTSIFCVAMIYRKILKQSAVADLWFWRFAYSVSSLEYYHQVFWLGNVRREGVLERFTFEPEPIHLGLNGFVERELLGGNMAQDPLQRPMWGFGSKLETPKTAKWSVAPASLVKVKPRGQQDGDCTIESVLGVTTPGTGTLTVVVATQPAKLEVPVTVAAELTLEPAVARVPPGGRVTLTARGLEGMADAEHAVVYAWRVAGFFGALSDGAGASGTAFETSSATVTYEADEDAWDQSEEDVTVTGWLVPASGARVQLGEAEATVQIRVTAPTCRVELGVYDAPSDWKWGDPTPLDVTCELASGVWVIDPDSITGCTSTAPCHAQCLGWGDPVVDPLYIGWATFDEEGTRTGGNHCSGGRMGSCDANVAWMKRACAEGFCEDPSMPDGGFPCAACSCACGGGNCYPWHGPGTIVFDASVNVPCTDGAECYYHQMPGRSTGSIGFTLVHCGSVDNALPSCPGHEIW